VHFGLPQQTAPDSPTAASTRHFPTAAARHHVAKETTAQVMEFLRDNPVDPEAAAMLKRAPSQIQRLVLEMGPVRYSRGASAKLMEHIREASTTHGCDTQAEASPVIVLGGAAARYDGDFRKWLAAGAPTLGRSSGRCYYEVLLGRGIEGMQIGWATERFAAGAVAACGVGTDEHGWAADGQRHMFWHSGASMVRWPDTWQVGDVVGCALDFESSTMLFVHNGKWALPVPFELPRAASLYPALSGKGDFTFFFSPSTFRFSPPSNDFKALLSNEDSAATFGCRGFFGRPKPHREIPPEAALAQQGKRYYHDTPFQQSVVDQVVFNRNMDFSGDNQFDATFTQMYKGRHGVKSLITDVAHSGEVEDTKRRHYANVPAKQSIVDQVVFGHDIDFSGESQYDHEFMQLFDGRFGKPSVKADSVSDKQARTGRRLVDTVERFAWLEEPGRVAGHRRHGPTR